MVERADINSVLMQMREIKLQAQQGVQQPSVIKPSEIQVDKSNENFGSLLKMAVDKVHDSQQHAKVMATAFEKGDPSVDLPQVMISIQKASVSFQAMTQVRNRLVSAYEDIMKMPI